MTYQNFPKNLLTVIAASVFIAGIYSHAWADGDTEVKPLELKRIMQELGRSMQTISDAISREDWALVAKIAPQIAEHPEPPVIEKMRILTFIGTNMGTFESHDEITHQAARALEQVASRNDGQGVITAFANLQSSCLACHQSFRQSFVEHFYGQR
ncbi:cytochrome C [Methylomonas methanica]|jgi:cytochrome c556|uniref:Cytochrome C n=2 Tax=Methylomonas TaxID=416 RepID=A0A177MXF0_METMH|nr:MULTISPECIES: cytochrome c [Methylomonas]OAH96013.1 cytochrome C [Methylomonas methanica]OAI10265.1 cytochrome C [Methylomonas methanica]